MHATKETKFGTKVA